MRFLCTYENIFGEGSTLRDAFENCKDASGDHILIEDAIFYEAIEIEVEQKIEKKVYPVKAIVPKLPVAKRGTK
jgi:hypothetical protein